MKIKPVYKFFFSVFFKGIFVQPRFFPRTKSCTTNIESKILFASMEHESPQQRGQEPDELEIGFIPSDPSMVMSQITKLSQTNRIIGFEAVVNLTNDGMTPEFASLLESGLLQQTISSINDSNIQIVGLICTALRRISAVAPDHFRSVMETVPIDFLLNVQGVPEVIDFLQESAFNFEQFGHMLLSDPMRLMNAVGAWLQNEATAKPTLELLYTLSQIPGNDFDFNCIKPFIDGQFSADMRMLALNILLQVEPQNAEQYLNMMMNIFLNDKPTPTVFQIIHDGLYTFSEFFQNLVPQLYQRAIENIEVPDSAILLADIAQQLDQQSKENIITQIFAQPVLSFERADSIFRLCNDCAIKLPANFVDQLISDMSTNESEETLQCTEGIVCLHSDYLASPEFQLKVLPILQRDSQFAVFGFRIILNCCANCPVVPQVLEAFHQFATQFESNLDPDMHNLVSTFLSNHKM